LTVAHAKVEEAQAAVQTITTTTTINPEKKAELVKIESSLVAAKQIVNDAIAKAEAAVPATTQA
jgi:hypothetical protein